MTYLPKAIFLPLFILTLSAFGCVGSSQAERQEAQLQALQVEVRDLKEQLQLKQMEMERQVSQTRTNMPEIRMEIDRMRSELQKMTNELELARAQDGSGAATLSLKDQMDLTRTRLDRLETKMQLPPLTPQVVNPTASYGGNLETAQPQPNIEVTPGVAAEPGAALFAEAQDLMNQRSYSAAHSKLKQLLSEFPNSSQAAAAQFLAGECLFEQNSYEEAILEYQKVVKNYPNSEKVSIALLKQAYAFINIGDKTSGKLLLQKVIREHPSSYAAGVAKKKLTTI